MEYLQRVILFISICFLLVIPVGLRYQQNCYYMATWTEAQTVCFFEEVCRNGICTTEEYQIFCEKIQKVSRIERIVFEEFKQSFGFEGADYRNYVSWDEIREDMESKGQYIFEENSEIRLYLAKKAYFGLVRRKHETT